MTLELETYEIYLNLIESRLIDKYFTQQQAFIKCQEGCSYCCESGQYPYSVIELKYLLLGYNKLSQEEKDIIQRKIDKIKKDKEEFCGEVFMYECPFLINKRCCIYNHRGIICRTHGLLFFITDEEGKKRNKIPNCVHLGLNYSNIYDKETKTISAELWEKSGIEAEPVAYNISLKALMKNDITREFGLDFGELKSLIDWFE